MTRLQMSDVSVDMGGIRIATGCALEVGPGERVGLVGPNGSGKTTLLRAVFRAVDPVAGRVTLDGQDVRRLNQRTIARRVALVHQQPPTEFDVTVEDLVALGRAPWQGSFDRPASADNDAVAAALHRTGLAASRSRRVHTLSGGERQRVLVARALAQDTPLLLLDEPTNHLDIQASLDLLELVRSLDKATLCVLHDLNLAAAYCDRVYVLQHGEVVAGGTPTEVFTSRLIGDVFGVGCVLMTHPSTGRLVLAFDPGGAPAGR